MPGHVRNQPVSYAIEQLRRRRRVDGVGSPRHRADAATEAWGARNLISTRCRTPDKQPPLLRGDLVRVPQDVEDQQSTIQRLVLLEQPPTNIRVAILRAILNNDL